MTLVQTFFHKALRKDQDYHGSIFKTVYVPLQRKVSEKSKPKTRQKRKKERKNGEPLEDDIHTTSLNLESLNRPRQHQNISTEDLNDLFISLRVSLHQIIWMSYFKMFIK